MVIYIWLVINFHLNFILVREYSLCDFSPLKYVETCFRARIITLLLLINILYMLDDLLIRSTYEYSTTTCSKFH